MDDTKGFLVLPYSLIDEAHASVDTHPLPDPKGRAVNIAFLGDREFGSRQAEYAFVGFTKPEPRTPSKVAVLSGLTNRRTPSKP
jgi:hypothetical protein